MNQIKNYRTFILATAVTPISHMMGTEGNEAVLMRESVYHDGQIKRIPVISGNAIRHRMIRDPGAMYLVDVMGLRGKLTIDIANYLFNGGSLTESSTNDNLKRIAEMQELFPLIRLLGGSLRNQIIGGSLVTYRGILICEENRANLDNLLGCGFLSDNQMKSAEEFVSNQTYTRCDVTKRKDSTEILDPKEKAPEKSTMMPYSGQVVIPGAKFLMGFHLQGVSVLEVGALYHALQMWEASGATIGGSSRIGHGVIQCSVMPYAGETFFGDEINVADCVQAYIQHCTQNADKMKQWLFDTFPERVIKEKKGKAKKETAVNEKSIPNEEQKQTEAFDAGQLEDNG
jgi:hypothetical protein